MKKNLNNGFYCLSHHITPIALIHEADLLRGYHEDDLVRTLMVGGHQLLERAMRRLVMVGHVVHARHVTTTGQRTLVRVVRTILAVVFVEFLDAVPRVRAAASGIVVH